MTCRAGLAQRLTEAAAWLADDLPEGVVAPQFLEGDVKLDELDAYCVDLMLEAAVVLSTLSRPDFLAHDAVLFGEAMADPETARGFLVQFVLLQKREALAQEALKALAARGLTPIIQGSVLGYPSTEISNV